LVPDALVGTAVLGAVLHFIAQVLVEVTNSYPVVVHAEQMFALWVVHAAFVAAVPFVHVHSLAAQVPVIVYSPPAVAHASVMVP